MEARLDPVGRRVPTLDEGTSQDPGPLIRIGLGFADHRHIGGDAPLQMKRELRVGDDVRLPVPLRAVATRQVVLTVEVMEIDLDSARLAGLTANRGDVGDTTPIQRLFHCSIHDGANSWNMRDLPVAAGAGMFVTMGQRIDVKATAVGDVAIFDLDRSLTGQDGVTFTAPPADGAPPATLARRLWESDGDLDNVHVLSNSVTVRRGASWDTELLDAASEVIADLFVYWEVETFEERAERLRAENYNATITSIRAHNPNLWVMRIEADNPIEPFKPGQYTTLGLGFWEHRADDSSEDFDSNPEQRDKMARRSYSVSSSIVDEDGELVSAHPEEIEFYIVQVPPGEGELPALTPRIFTREVGDRIFMSHKFTGRYTLDGVEPDDNVVFLSTGTGEAPQNLMTAELLRNDHRGRILQVVCVRYRKDLAYTEQQAIVEERFPNYRYVILTTREPENEGNKIYIQDMLEASDVEKELGVPLDPATTHFFLCGNPLMIGLPKWDDDGTMHFPEHRGVCEILHERGFTIDHLRERGNVHYEEYWKER